MKQKIFLYSLGLFLALGVLASLSQIYAQNRVNNGQAVEPESGTIIYETKTTKEPMIYEADTTPVNSLWLIPIIIIPFMVYLLWPKERDEFIGNNYGNLVGFKGGRVRRDSKEFLPENNRF